jgi:predicted transcriptional regulator
MDSSAGEGYIITRYYRVIRGSAMATSLKIDDGLKSRIQNLANQRRRSAHWIMLEAIEQYVQREEARESFKQEALASWAAYQETGRHLTGQEVRSWLNTWGTDDEKAAPECHK